MSDSRRSLKTTFWTDPYVEELDADTTYVFNCLLSNPLTNLCGAYEITPKRIAEYTKLPVERVKKSLQKLQDDCKIMSYKQWIAIKNHVKNQSLNPNMAWQVVQLLRKTPTVIRAFILLDDGDDKKPMPWLDDFLRLITSYMKSQNERRLKLESEGKKYPGVPTHYKYFDMGYDFAVLLEDLSEGVTITQPLPNGYLSLTQPLGNPIDNIRVRVGAPTENEIERESKKEREREIEVVTLTPPRSFREVTRQEIDALFAAWDAVAGLPVWRKTAFEVSTEFLAICMNEMKRFSEQEIVESFRNYSTMVRDRNQYDPINYGSPVGFIEKGIGKHLSVAMPFETYRRKYFKETKLEDLPLLPDELKNGNHVSVPEDDSPWPTDDDYDPELDERE